MSDNKVTSLFNVISLATNVLSEHHEGSVLEYTDVCNSKLVCTIEDRLTHSNACSNVMKIALNVYIAHYLMAVRLMTTVGDVQVRQVLDRLNPNRDVVQAGKDRIEQFAVLESRFDYPQFTAFEPVPALEASTPPAGSAGWAQDAPHLGMGKVFDVSIQQDDKVACIPVRVTLSPVTCNQQMFVSMYGDAGQQNTFINRWRRWRDGELSTIADMIFVNDILSDKAAILKMDKKGIVKEIEKRRNKNKISTLITQKTSIATASTISIITKDTANLLALNIGGRIEDDKVRHHLFAKSGIVIMAVIDEMYETITLYYRGQNGGTEISFKEAEFASGGKGPNPMEILKALQSSQVPNF